MRLRLKLSGRIVYQPSPPAAGIIEAFPLLAAIRPPESFRSGFAPGSERGLPLFAAGFIKKCLLALKQIVAAGRHARRPGATRLAATEVLLVRLHALDRSIRVLRSTLQHPCFIQIDVHIVRLVMRGYDMNYAIGSLRRGDVADSFDSRQFAFIPGGSVVVAERG